MATKFRPMNDFVLIKRAERAAMTPGGIHVPEAAQETSVRGEVLAVGPGKVNDAGKRVPPAVSAGDVVLLPKYGGTEIQIDGEKLVLIHEEEIHGYYEKED